MTRLAIYTFEVHAPDEMADSDIDDYSMALIDGAMQAAAEIVTERVQEVDSRLTVEFKD